MQEILVSQEESGQRLDKFLRRRLPLAPSSFIYKMLRKKNITLRGKKADGSEKVETARRRQSCGSALPGTGRKRPGRLRRQREPTEVCSPCWDPRRSCTRTAISWWSESPPEYSLRKRTVQISP